MLRNPKLERILKALLLLLFSSFNHIGYLAYDS